jgi:hypothetical protein
MSKRIASAATLFAASSLAATVTLLGASRAEAQCVPGSLFCAQVSVGVGVSGSLTIGSPPPVMVAQPVAPPPPVVVYQPAQPPVVVVAQPQPTTMIVAQPVPQVRLPAPVFGIRGEIGAMTTDRIAMGGAGVALRYRPGPFVAFDFGLGVYGGEDYHGAARVEMPVTANALFFFNPQSPLQFYSLAGLGYSFASTDRGLGADPWGVYDDHYTTEFSYLGGQVGLGLEWRLSPWFAVNGDVRGFIRQRVGGGTPEFRDAATGRTTNTSGGVYWTLGTTFYF